MNKVQQCTPELYKAMVKSGMIPVPKIWCAPLSDTIFIKRKRCKKIRELKPGEWTINRYTPVGDSPTYYEIKPFGGRREFFKEDIVGIGDNND